MKNLFNRPLTLGSVLICAGIGFIVWCLLRVEKGKLPDLRNDGPLNLKGVSQIK